MPRIAYFGHSVSDSAIRRRVRAMRHDGFDVTGFMIRRQDNASPDWKNVDLGRAHDRALVKRVKSIFVGARRAAKHADLREADVIIARNLDMLATAFLAKRLTNLKTPVIYECLDVHIKMVQDNFVGKVLRWIEGKLLSRCRGLITSSPGFLRNYFDKYHAGKYKAYLVENRLAAGSDYGVRPTQPKKGILGKLRLGWVGMLRCQRSLDLLCALAEKFPDTLEIRIHGIHAKTEIDVFEPEIDKRQNMIFAGRYKSPEDLASIYNDIDVVWAGDFMDAGYNSVWLLPNRIYEGGYYGVPSIAPKGTETGNWIAEKAAGFTLEEALEDTLGELVSRLMKDRTELDHASRSLIALEQDVFVEPQGLIRSIIENAQTGLA